MTVAPDPPIGRRGSLSLDVIVDGALQLARTEGLAGLSMRRLAMRLGVKAMSLYYWVPNKAALQVLMADRSAAAVLVDRRDGDGWPARLVELLLDTYRAGVDNPALFEVLAGEQLRSRDLPTADPEAGSALIALLDEMTALLQQGPLSPEQVAQAFRGLIALIVGFIVVEVDGLLLSRRPSARTHQRGSTRLADLAPALAGTDRADGVRFSLELFVDGLQRAGSEPAFA